MRIALGVEYDGSAYRGWEQQKNQVTVQQCIERALSRVANRPVTVVTAGRTDSGVHALGQVVHFDTDVERTPRSWIFGSNANLPGDVAVTWARVVADDFHARFSARSRYYRYLILNRTVRPGLMSGRVSWCYRSLNLEAMQNAAGFLVGEHDFSAYRATACQAKSPVRTVYRLTVERHMDLVMIDVEANAFLHHMVRNIAGVLMAIGSGKYEPRWAQDVLLGRDRRLGGVTAPADGLYLLAVRYPDHCDIPVAPTKHLVSRLTELFDPACDEPCRRDRQE